MLYADDTVILAENEDDLQKALDALNVYCKLWSLTVNLKKTKIIIFSRGKVRKHVKFLFDGKEVEVVDDYVYLGIKMNYNNSMNKAIQKQITLAKKSMFSMLSSVQNLNLPVDLQLNLFQKLVLPVLLYGCEIWGYTDIKAIEQFHRKYLKSVLKLSKYTANSMVYGEMGIHKLEVTVANRMVSFWYRLKFGKDTKIASIIFNLMKKLFDQNVFKSKWMSQIHNIFDKTGLSYLWNSNSVNLNSIIKNINQRLIDANMQNWASDLENNSLCLNYKIFKNDFYFEPYLRILDSELRTVFCRFRCGNHNLPIMDKRYDEIDDRNNCPLCFSDVGDEYHYLLSCPAFHWIRRKYVNESYFRRPNTEKFKTLMCTKNKRDLVKLSLFIKFILHVFRP